MAARKSIYQVQDHLSAYVAIGSKLIACLSLIGLIVSGGVWLYYWRESSHYVTEFADARIVEDQARSKVDKLGLVISQAEHEHKNAIEKRLSILGVVTNKHEQISSRLRATILDLQSQISELARKNSQAIVDADKAKENLQTTMKRTADIRESISADTIAQKANDDSKGIALEIAKSEESLSIYKKELLFAKQSHDLEIENYRNRIQSNSFAEIQQAEKDFQKYRDRLKIAEKNVKSTDGELKVLKDKKSKSDALASPQGSQNAARLAWQSIDESNATQISLAKAKVTDLQSSIKYLESEMTDSQRKVKDLNEALIQARQAELLEKKEAESIVVASQATLANSKREEKQAKDEFEKSQEATQKAFRASVNAGRSGTLSIVSFVVCGLLLFASGVFAIFAHLLTGAGASVEALQSGAKANLISAEADMLEAEGLAVRHKSEAAARLLEAKSIAQKRIAEAKAITGQASVAKANAKVIRAKQTNASDQDS